ncbi:SKI family protein [Megaselia abdita]
MKINVDAVPPHIFQHEQLTVIPTKKPKLPDEQQFHHNYFQLQQALCNIQYDQVIRSAFHSWPWPMPYFQQEPILQNPERVVRLTGNERFDGGFQPNVALAPRKPRDKEIEKDKNSRNNVAINSEIQIKQERPSSSDAIIQSPEATPTPTPPQISHPPPPLVSRHTNLKPISLPHKKQHHHHQHLQPRSPDELSSSSEITSSTSPIPKTKDSIKNSKSPLTVISTLQQQQGNKLVQLQHRTQQEIYAAEQLQNPQLNPQTSRIRINKNLMNNSNIIRTPTPDMQNFKPNNNNNNASFPPSSSIHQLNVNPAPTISPPAVALSLISRRQDDKDNGNGCIITKKLHQNGVENGEADSQSHVTASPLTWESSLDALIKDIPQVHQRDKIWKIINKILDDNAQMKSNQRLLEKKYQLELQLQSEQIIDLQREIQYLRQQQLDSQHYHQPMNGVINDSVTVTPVIAANKTPTTTTTMISQPIIKNDIVVEKIKMPLKKSSRRSFEEARVQSEVVNLKTSNQLTVTTVTGNGNNNNPTTIQNNTTKCEDRDSLKNEDTISTTTTTLTTKKPQQTNSIITPTISPTSSSSSPDSAVFDIKHGGSGSDDQKSTTSSSTSSSPSPAGGISIKTEE